MINNMSLRLDIQRVFREGLIDFWRNKIVSFAAVLVMTMALLLMSAMVFMNSVLDFSLAQLQDRVDVNIYFLPDTPESEIIDLQERIALIPEVRDVAYISREEAFVSFKERHAGDDLITRSLDELGDNPLGASLNIRAWEATQYEAVVNALESEPVIVNSDFVERINYYDNKSMIERLNQFGHTVQSVGYALSIFLAVIVILVVLSMIRITIFSAHKEIVVKRLVGAEHRYIRGPFVVVGALYGIIAGVITILLLYPLSGWVAQYTDSFFGGMNIFKFYLMNDFKIGVIVIGLGIILGVVASMLAMKKYLRV